jgi:polysaccharide export outer membrane protein
MGDNVFFINRITLLYLVLLAFTNAVPAYGQEESSSDIYRLGPGDELQVTVFGEADLTENVRISEDGRVVYAFVGEFDFFGKTIDQAETEIHERLLGDFLVNPQVSVSISEFRPFFIHGEVANQGSYAYEPGLTVRKAIGLAGGLKERASSKKWYLIPEGGTEADKRQVTADDPVGPGDSITIEQSFF